MNAGRPITIPSAPSVCVLGMPGSGAALVTEILRDQGVWFGEDESLVATVGDDPEAAYLSQAVVDVNNGVACLLDERRSMFSGDPCQHRGLPGFDFLEARGRSALGRIISTAGGRPWGWRHPHGLHTVPFWCWLVAPLKAVVCVKACDSLPGDQTASEGGSDAAWSPYERILKALLPPWQMIVTHYENWCAAPWLEFERVAAFLGLAETNLEFSRAALTTGPLDSRDTIAIGAHSQQTLTLHRPSLDHAWGGGRRAA